jgi:4-amino-4-deoxy-L-arabinose transferase-like glycosyltransferase
VANSAGGNLTLSTSRAHLLGISIFILWIFFVLGSFFAVQKPFSATNAIAVGKVLLDVVVAGWLVLIGLGLGSWLLQRLQPAASFGETLILGTAIGLGLLGLLNFALGLAGLFNPVVAYAIAVILTLPAIPQWMRLWRQRKNGFGKERPGFLPLAYLIVITVLTLLVAMLPPTDWDGLFYHLTGPKLYLQAGGIVGGINIPHLSFPSLMEMLFAWAMLLRGDIAAKLLHTVYAFLLAGLVYLTACRFLGKKAIGLALLVLASMPMVSTLAGWAYNDLALAFYQLAALYAFICWTNQARDNIFPSAPSPQSSTLAWLIVSGTFAGLAMGLKYTGFVTPLIIVGFILWYSVRQASHPTLRPILTNLAAFALPALLVALPWYLKNWLFTGNPIYPFLYNIFGGQFWDSFRADWYAAAGTGIGWRPGTLLTLPWLLTLGIKDMNYWDGRTGPLLLLFLPVIIWAGFFRQKERPPVVGWLLLYVLVHYLFWAMGVMWSRSLWQSRLLLPALVALAPLAGWVWAGLSEVKVASFSLGRFVSIAIGLTLALTMLDVGLLTLKINPLPYLTGLESREAYLARHLGAHYQAMQYINQTLPPDAVVVFLWEPRSYYCARDCRPDSILDTFPHLVDQYGSAEAIARAWQQAGVTHVLVHRSGLEFVLSESPEVVDRTVLTELETRFLNPVAQIGRAYDLYKLGADP